MIAFANADLSASTDADVERWQWEIMAWSLGDPRGLDIEREFTEVFAFTLSPLLPQLDLLTLREEVQRTLRTYLGALVDTGEVSFGNYQGELVVKLRADGTGHRRVLGSAVIQFFNRVSEVFEKFGSRLRVCDPPACEKYVAAVGHYRYCSPACSQRVRTRRHEQKKRQTAPPRRRAAG